MIKVVVLVFVAIASTAFGQWHQSGQFPAGHYYTESELPELVGQKITQPAYLIGSFVFVNQAAADVAIFSAWSSGLTDPSRISFPSILVGDKFHNNEPSSFHFGSLIEPNEKDPLTLIKVGKGQQEEIIAVTEQWSAP